MYSIHKQFLPNSFTTANWGVNLDKVYKKVKNNTVLLNVRSFPTHKQFLKLTLFPQIKG